MPRLDSWTDPEVQAAANALASFAEWQGGAVSGVRATAQAQLQAEIARLVALVPKQGTAIMQRFPFHVSGLADGKLQQEAWWQASGMGT